MATAQNIIDTAGGYLRIVASPGAAVDATTSADMLKVLQGMVGIWSEQQLVDCSPPSTVGTTISESPGVIEAMAQNLAIIYGQNVGKQVDLVTASLAKEDKSWLETRRNVNRELSMASDGMPSTSRGRYNINTDS